MRKFGRKSLIHGVTYGIVCGAVCVLTAGFLNLTDAYVYAEDTEVMTEAEEEQEEFLYHVMFIGVDRRDDSWEGNSDTMMLVSVNEEKEQISIISMMRDMGVDIPGIGVQKMNAANANGGAELVLETVQENFGVDVERYVRVDFENLITIVDAVGGVELTISDAEAEQVNGGVTYLCNLQGIDPTEYYLPCGGTYLCNGMQAVNYARIRFVGNADYERTERQRTILTKILEKVKELDVENLLVLLQEILKNVDHNIPFSELMKLLMRADEIMQYEVITDRIPYDGLYHTEGEMLMPDWDATLERLNETLY